jgi:hypothetical protein
MWGITCPRRPEHYSEAGERRFPYGTSHYYSFSVRLKESLGDRSAGGAEPLGRCDFRQRDVGSGRHYTARTQIYKVDPWARDLYSLSISSRTRVLLPVHCSERTAAPPRLGPSY